MRLTPAMKQALRAAVDGYISDAWGAYGGGAWIDGATHRALVSHALVARHGEVSGVSRFVITAKGWAALTPVQFAQNSSFGTNLS